MTKTSSGANLKKLATEETKEKIKLHEIEQREGEKMTAHMKRLDR